MPRRPRPGTGPGSRVLASLTPVPAALVAAAFALGCGAPDRAGETAPAAVRSAIQGGYDDDDDKAAVGIAITNLSGFFSGCSGSLIAPSLVLTARHCVAQTTSPQVVCGKAPFGPTRPPEWFWVTTRRTLSFDPSIYYRAQEVRTAPGGDDNCGFDIAVILLKQAVPSAEAKPMIPRIDVEPAKDEVYSAVGYGQTCPTCQNSGFSRRRRDALVVQCNGPDCNSGSIKESEWRGDKAVCSGDSGGPAVDAQGRVFGVASRGGTNNGECVYPIYGRVDSWFDFLSQAALDAAKIGGYKPPPWATTGSSDPDAGAQEPDAGPQEAGTPGQPCDAQTPCPVGMLCVAGQPNYCAPTCSEASPTCPPSYSCVANAGVCVKQAEPPPASGPEGVPDNSRSTKGCAVARSPGGDPKPVPWIAALAVSALAARRRRRAG